MVATGDELRSAANTAATAAAEGLMPDGEDALAEAESEGEAEAASAGDVLSAARAAAIRAAEGLEEEGAVLPVPGDTGDVPAMGITLVPGTEAQCG